MILTTTAVVVAVDCDNVAMGIMNPIDGSIFDGRSRRMFQWESVRMW